MFAGVPTTICPAPNHVVALDLDRSLFPAFKVEPPAIHLHVLLPGADEIVTHTVPIGDFGAAASVLRPGREVLYRISRP